MRRRCDLVRSGLISWLAQPTMDGNSMKRSGAIASPSNGSGSNLRRTPCTRILCRPDLLIGHWAHYRLATLGRQALPGRGRVSFGVPPRGTRALGAAARCSVEDCEQLYDDKLVLGPAGGRFHLDESRKVEHAQLMTVHVHGDRVRKEPVEPTPVM